MTEMLDNRSFDESTPDVIAESDVTPVQSSTDTQEVEPEKIISEEESTDDVVEATTEKTIGETPSEQSDVVEPSQESKSSRARKRIQKLIQEKKELEGRLQQQAVPAQQQFQRNESGEIEMTPDQLTAYINSQVQGTLAYERERAIQEERAELWDSDIEDLMATNPELDPKSDKFDKDINDALIDIIRAANTDDNGQPTVRKLPSEIWATMQKTVRSAKNAGRGEASVNLAKVAEESAVQNSVTSTEQTAKYSDEALVKLQQTDPRKYAELIEKNII